MPSHNSRSKVAMPLLIELTALACLSISTTFAQIPSPVLESGSASAADPLFKEPYIDIDEWRDKPVRHRYVHGGFRGTTALFAFYFPPQQAYEGRFFQHITPAPSSENIDETYKDDTAQHMQMALASGAYFVQTNEGGPSAIAGDQTVVGYRINAAGAEYSRVVAEKMYGPKRPYGYAFGGSGGCFKSTSGFENTSTWDGAVPFVCGSPMAIPNVFTVRLLAMRLLNGKFASIMDGVEPGARHDMYSGLDAEQQGALREVTKMGFPPAGWFNYQTIGEGAFPVLIPIVKLLDGAYFKDFWTVPGYEGASPVPSLARARIQYSTVVVRVVRTDDLKVQPTVRGGVDATKNAVADSASGLQVENLPSGNLEGASVVIKSGSATGREFPVGKVVGNTLFLAVNPFAPKGTNDPSDIRPGDEVVLDNSDFLAAQYYHRHQVPGPDYYVWNQYRGSDGKPLEPQEKILIGPLVTGAGSVQSGRFKGKMIMIESMMDQDALPWQADWYRTKVLQNLGDHLNDNFRLWYVEHALHSDDARQGDKTHTISYVPELYQALLDVSAWIEKGVSPPASTNYKVVDGQIIVPAHAVERAGIQPVVSLKVRGLLRAEVAVGQEVPFSALVEVPPNTGRILKVEMDFDGDGTFPLVKEYKPSKNDPRAASVKFSTSHKYAKEGTYFVTLRATSQRQLGPSGPFTQVQNLGRVRVVVK